MRWHYGNASEFMRQYEALVLGPACGDHRHAGAGAYGNTDRP